MAVIEQTRFEVLPMGEYSAVIKDAQLDDGMYGPQVAFTFEIEGGEHDGSNLRHWTSAKFSRMSKLFALAKAAFGKPIPETYNLNTDDLIGRKVNLMVIVRVKAEDGTEFNKVDDVRAWRQLDDRGRPVAQQALLTNSQQAQGQIGVDEELDDYPF